MRSRIGCGISFGGGSAIVRPLRERSTARSTAGSPDDAVKLDTRDLAVGIEPDAQFGGEPGEAQCIVMAQRGLNVARTRSGRRTGTVPLLSPPPPPMTLPDPSPTAEAIADWRRCRPRPSAVTRAVVAASAVLCPAFCRRVWLPASSAFPALFPASGGFTCGGGGGGGGSVIRATVWTACRWVLDMPSNDEVDRRRKAAKQGARRWRYGRGGAASRSLRLRLLRRTTRQEPTIFCETRPIEEIPTWPQISSTCMIFSYCTVRSPFRMTGRSGVTAFRSRSRRSSSGMRDGHGVEQDLALVGRR